MADTVEVASPSGSSNGNENSLGSSSRKTTDRVASSASDLSVSTSTGSSGSSRRNPTDPQVVVSGSAENAMPIEEEGPQASSDSAQVSIAESVSNSPAPAAVGNTFILGRSRVNHQS